MIAKIMLFLIFLSFQTLAQSPLTLQQAIQKSWANRKNIQSGKSDLAIRKLQTEALYKKYWPQVSLEYIYQYNPILQTSILPIGQFNPSYPADAYKNIQFGTRWSQTAGITVTQPLLDASTRRQINEYELQEKITSAFQMQTEYDLAYNVAQAYMNVNLQEQQILSAITDTGRTWLSYQLQKEKFEAKRLLKSDLNTARINHNNAVQKFRDAVSQLVENKVYLLFMVGDTNLAADFQTDTVSFGRYPWQIESQNTFHDSIPELKQLDYEAELMGLQQRSEKARYLPTLSLKGYLGANQYTGTFNPLNGSSWFGYSYVGVDLKYPLLFGEDKQRKIQQLQLQALQYRQQREDKSAQYAKDVATAKIRMNRAGEQLRTLEENILLSRETIQIIQDRVAEGEESAYTLNSEEAGLQRLEADYQFNKVQMAIYWLDYLKASGQLSLLWKN